MKFRAEARRKAKERRVCPANFLKAAKQSGYKRHSKH